MCLLLQATRKEKGMATSYHPSSRSETASVASDPKREGYGNAGATARILGVVLLQVTRKEKGMATFRLDDRRKAY